MNVSCLEPTVKAGAWWTARLIACGRKGEMKAQTGPKSEGTLMIRIVCTMGGNRPAQDSDRRASERSVNQRERLGLALIAHAWPLQKIAPSTGFM